MILVTLDHIFEPGDGADAMDNDRVPGLATKSHSMVGYLDGNRLEGCIVKFENLQHVVSTATLNPNTDYYIEFGLSVNNYLDGGPNVGKLAEAIESTQNIHLLFSHGWDLYSSRVYGWVKPHTTLQCVYDRIAMHKEAFKNIDNSRIHYWVGNTVEVKKLQTHFPGADVRYYSIYPMRMIAKQYESDLDFYEVPDKSKKRNKHFLCMNNYDKAHRTDTVKYIIDAELESKFNLSYLKPDDQSLQRILDGKFEMDNIEQWQDVVSHDVINDCYLYIATETHCEPIWKFGRVDDQNYKHDTLIFLKEDKEKWQGMEIPIDGWISEKSLKSMYYGLPIMIVGIPGQLKVLKDLGFETFPEFYDESYDSISYYGERFEIIKQNIHRLSNTPIDEIHELYYSDSVQNKLRHNKQLFMQMIRSDPYMQFYNYGEIREDEFLENNPKSTFFQFHDKVFKDGSV